MDVESAAEKAGRLPDEREMWMSPAAAIAMLQQKGEMCEVMKDKFTKIE